MSKFEKLFVLIACEESQAECTAFRQLGHIAFSCDLQECRKKGHPEWHIVGDVTPYLQGKCEFITQAKQYNVVPRWDLIIAHPPCTYLCKVGSPHLYKNADYRIRWKGSWLNVNANRLFKLKEARSFFKKCLDAKVKYLAVENPCPMKLAQLPPASFFACPSWYGYKYTKKTYYWVRNLPPLMPTYINPNATCLVKSTRGKYRSRTPQCLANAIAEQWSNFILNDL